MKLEVMEKMEWEKYHRKTTKMVFGKSKIKLKVFGNQSIFTLVRLILEKK